MSKPLSAQPNYPIPRSSDRNNLPTPQGNHESLLRTRIGHRVLTPLFPTPTRAQVLAQPHKYDALAVRTWEQVEGLRRELGLSTVVPLGPTLALTEPRGLEDTNDWVAYPAAYEPYFQQNEEFVLPEAEHERLRGLLDLGMDFDDCYLIHEYASGTIRHYGINQIPSVLADPPPSPRTLSLWHRLAQRSDRMGQRTDTSAAELVGTTIGVGAGIAAAATLATAGLGAAALVGLLAGLDPLVLGAVHASDDPQPGDPVFLYVLAMWRW